MVLEIVSSFLMLLWPTPNAPLWLRGAGVTAASITWLSTFLISVPLHGRLGTHGHDSRAIRTLVVTNGIRLAAWFVHSLVLLAITALEIR